MRDTFFIKQNSTLPEITFPISQHILEKYNISEDMMENVAITFSMTDSHNRYKIANVGARLDVIEDDYERLDDCKYNLVYRPNLSDTNESGVFNAEFVIDFLGNNNCGKIKFPLEKDLKIIIDGSITKTSVIQLVPSGIYDITFDDTFE